MIRFRAHSTLARFTGPAALCAAGLLLCAPVLRAASDPTTPINGITNSVWRPDSDGRFHLIVSGIGATEVIRLGTSGWTSQQWQQWITVHVDEAPRGAPAVTGSYRVEGNTVVFVPAFPLQPGITYRTETRLSGVPPIIQHFRTPDRPAAPATTITAVYPSTDVLPENLLKFYLHFSAPMNRGDIYKYIHLLDQSGKEVELPFLELGEELWNPAMTRVTIFIDPGRIKRGVRELMENGPALTVGHTQTLVIDAAWTDGNGRPLREGFRKTFRVAAADRTAIDPQQWKLTPAAAGTRGALVIDFPEPLDHALAERLLEVVALASGTRRPVDGTATLSEQERRLRFVPAAPWVAGSYELEIPAILEDLAGNKVGKVFDVDVFDQVQRNADLETAKLAFTVK